MAQIGQGAAPQQGTAEWLKALLAKALGGQYPVGPEREAFGNTDPNQGSLFGNTVRGLGNAAVMGPFDAIAEYQRDIGIPFQKFFTGTEADLLNPLPPDPNRQFGVGIQPGTGAPGTPALDLPPTVVESGADPLSTIIGALGGGGGPPGPDYSEMDSWLERAAPKSADPAQIKALQFSALMEGLGAGAANIDTTSAGPVGSAIAALGAGASKGRKQGDLFKYQTDETDEKEMRDYALTRAEAAQQKANAAARQAEASYARKRPKILHASDSSIVMERVDEEGNIKIEKVDIGTDMDKAAKILDMGKALGATEEVAQVGRYSVFKGTRNLPAYKLSMIQDAIKGGYAPELFGEAYTKHRADVEQELEDSGGTGSPEGDAARIDQLTSLRILQDVPNEDWIMGAAKFGNVGANLLLADSQ